MLRINKPTRLQLVILAVILLTGIGGFVMMGSLRAAVMLILLFGILISRNKKLIKAAACVIVLLVFAAFPPLYVRSQALWKYPFQKTVIGLYQNITEPEWFPEFSRDVKGDFKFDYAPSVMQATGHYLVYFQTDEKTLDRYEQLYSEQAAYSFPMREYFDESIYDGHIPELKTEKNGFKKLTIYLTSGSPKGYDDAQAYVLASDLDFNHPHTSAVIINKADSSVTLTQLG